jgi:hypothetical protein
MDIAFDSKSSVAATGGATSLTFSFNNVAGDFVIVCGHDRTGNTSVVSGVTYGGNAMTKKVELAGNASFNDRAITLWVLTNPPTGSNNVVVTASSTQNMRFHAYSYTGVDQSTPDDGTDTSTGGSGSTSIATDITTATDGAWMIMFGKDQNGNRTYTNTTGDSIRLNADAGGHSVTDTGAAISPAGANTITNTMTSVNGIGAIAYAFKPAGGGGGGSPTPTLMMMGVGS